MRTATILMVMLALVALATVGGFTKMAYGHGSDQYPRYDHRDWDAGGRYAPVYGGYQSGNCGGGHYGRGYGIDWGRVIETAIGVGADIYQSRQNQMYDQSVPMAMPAPAAYYNQPVAGPVPAHLAIYGVRNGYGQSGYGQPVADSYPPVPASARTTIVNNNNIVVMQTPQAHQPPPYVAPAPVPAAPVAPAPMPPPPPVAPAPVASAPIASPSEAAKEPTPPSAPAPAPVAAAPVAPVAEGGWKAAAIVLAVLVAILAIFLVIVIRRRGGRGGEPAPSA